MAANQFYEDELTYLRELGVEFARANPKLAGFLGTEANDPDVERLLEGFAFIAARLRQKLDDELPELVHGLIRLIWPHYLRPIPPMTVIGFEAGAAASEPVILPAGTQLRSRMVEGVSCPFSTCYPVEVLPLTIADVQLENRSTSARLSFEMRGVGRGTLNSLAGGRIRLFFNTERDPAAGRALLLAFLRNISKIECSTDAKSVVLRQEHVRPVGFDRDDAVLPWPANSFTGFRLLQEYLVFPAKFLFVDIVGLEGMASETARSCRLTIEFQRPFPDSFRVSDGQIRLNCSPAINLFSYDGQPIRIDSNKTEHRILPNHPDTQGIYSIEEVAGYVQGRPERRIYTPFESFRHDLPGGDAPGHYYRERLRPSVVGRGVDTYVSFVNRLGVDTKPNSEVVSLRLRCTNGPVADRIPVGGIDQPPADFPNTVLFTNLIAVTPEISPPIGDGLLWRLMSNLARNYGSLVDVEALRATIASYDFRAVQDAQARRRLELLLAGLKRFETQATDWVLKGMPVRMRQIRLFATESQIGGDAELFLLGSVLDAFLSSYTTVNNLHRFAIEGMETKVVYEWPPRTGSGAPI